MIIDCSLIYIVYILLLLRVSACAFDILVRCQTQSRPVLLPTEALCTAPSVASQGIVKPICEDPEGCLQQIITELVCNCLLPPDSAICCYVAANVSHTALPYLPLTRHVVGGSLITKKKTCTEVSAHRSRDRHRRIRHAVLV